MNGQTGEWITFPIGTDFWSPKHFAIGDLIRCGETGATDPKFWQRETARPHVSECCRTCHDLVDQDLASHVLFISFDGSIVLGERSQNTRHMAI